MQNALTTDTAGFIVDRARLGRNVATNLPTAGTITSAGIPRQIPFGLNLVY